MLKNIEELYLTNKYAIILAKLYIVSVVVLILLSKTAAIALRFSEFFVVVEIVALPLIVELFVPRNKLIARILLILFSGILLFFHFRSKTLLIF